MSLVPLSDTQVTRIYHALSAVEAHLVTMGLVLKWRDPVKLQQYIDRAREMLDEAERRLHLAVGVNEHSSTPS